MEGKIVEFWETKMAVER